MLVVCVINYLLLFIAVLVLNKGLWTEVGDIHSIANFAFSVTY